MKLQFLGANRQVTGSCYCLEAGGLRILVDCGMFQERDFQQRNWDRCPTDPASIDVVLLTHAHLDHSGLLPRFARNGFSGRILATRPTIKLADLVMSDSARIQEEDMAYKRRRHKRQGRKARHSYEPLYRTGDVDPVVSHMDAVEYDEAVALNDKVSVRFVEAGHILGSATVVVDVRDGESRRIVFSGDVGQWDVPIVGDPTLIDSADYVVLESTYGDEDHDRPDAIEVQLADVVKETMERGGNVVIPTFAIERAQEVMLHLAHNILAQRMPPVVTFLDSPMAIDATEIFRRHTDFMDDETRAFVESEEIEQARRWLRRCRTQEESKAINAIRGTCIIMAGSGMCTGGRIKHHLAHNIGRPESTIVFVGYQAEGTLGREIVDGEPKVRILGRHHEVKARVHQIQGLSAHAGRSDLMRWLRHLDRPPRQVFLTHGEEQTSLALADHVSEELGYEVSVPRYLEEVELI